MFDFLLSFLTHSLKSCLGVVGTQLLLHHEKTFLALFATFIDLGEYISFGELRLVLNLAFDSSVVSLILSLTLD
jgi:hypothetical protein